MLDAHGIVMDVHEHMAVVLVPIMLSTWIRNLKYLVPVSSIANFLMISGYIATIYIMSHKLPSIHERKYVADWDNLPLFFGTVIYSFEGITLVSINFNTVDEIKNWSFNILFMSIILLTLLIMYRYCHWKMKWENLITLTSRWVFSMSVWW